MRSFLMMELFQQRDSFTLSRLYEESKIAIKWRQKTLILGVGK